MEISYPAGRDVIESVLPHRDPFGVGESRARMRTRRLRQGRARRDPDLPLFEGHFPDYPVLPGVIIMEALAQAASFSILVEREAEGTLGFFAGIDNAKFRNQVRPGDTLTLEATIVKSSRRMCVAEVKASVGDTVCATATQKYVLATADSAYSRSHNGVPA